MTVKEELEKFTHEVEEVLHEVEEVFQEVKEHMIVSVRDFSVQIAFVLMSITSAILVIGTVYVWCFHHPKHAHEDNSNDRKQSQSEHSDQPEEDHSEQSDSVESVTKFPEGNVAEECLPESSDKADETGEDIAEKSEQNGQVRKRTTSSSINNNNSPVKSKIPVRQKSRT